MQRALYLQASLQRKSSETSSPTSFIMGLRMLVLLHALIPCLVVGSVCVCQLSHISPLERLFVLKILSHTQQATEVKICRVFSETARLQRSSTCPLKAVCTVGLLHIYCPHPLSCCIYTALVFLLFSTVIPTSFNI